VIVLDTLSGRKVVVDQRGADTRDLVGADGRADAAAAVVISLESMPITTADCHATLHLPCYDRRREGDHEVWIVIAIVQLVSAEIDPSCPAARSCVTNSSFKAHPP
jgi:hypothetical protein